MPTMEIKVTLPENLAKEAAANGLLDPGAIEKLLRDEVRRRQIDHVLGAADRMAAAGEPRMSDEEIEEEIAAARNERQNRARGT